ncbi:hypothetical protein JCM8097_002815 [Rhodosporidiobolus ruineniae]
MLDNLLVAAIIGLLVLAWRFFKSAKPSPPSSTDTKPAEPYRFPPVTALRDHDVKALEAEKPIAFRPFKYNYPQTMGIRNLPSYDDWLHIDGQYSHMLEVRTRRTRGTDPELRSTATQPGFHAHALEALCELASFLSTRFPQLFKVKRTPYVPGDESTYGDSIVGIEGGAIVSVENCVTGERWDFKEIEAKEGKEWDPFKIAGLLTQDDLVLMVEDPTADGQYRFRAGSVCTAGFWKLNDKLGMTLDEIHFSGSMPDYADKYQKSMNRFFTNMKEDKIVERNNYFFQVNDGYDWATSNLGTEQIFDQFDKVAKPGMLETFPGAVGPTPATDISQIRFRTERQTLRRMPRTRGILFTVRTYMWPLVDIADEPGVPGRLASGFRHWPDKGKKSVKWFKSASKYEHIILPFLDQKHEEQVRNGVIVLDEKGHAPHNYPY